MAKKDLTQGMAKGLGSLLQPTTPKPTDETPTQQQAPVEKKPNRQPIITPSSIEGMVAVGVRKKNSGNKAKVRPHTPSVTSGLQEGYTRATIIAQVEQIDKLKEIAYQTRSSLRETIEQAFKEYIDNYEEQHGTVKVIVIP